VGSPRALPHVADEPPAAAAPTGEARGEPTRTGSFPPEVYAQRRARLAAQMKTGVAVVYGAASMERGLDGLGRQDPDFYYLTGIEDDGAALVLTPQEPLYRETLYLKTRDPDAERWSGERASITQDLRVRTGFRAIRRTGRLGFDVAEEAQHWRELVFLGPLVGPESPLPPALDLYDRVAGRVPGTRVRNAIDVLARLREVKETAEIEKIRRATDITGAAFAEMMARVHPGMREFELKDVFDAAIRKGGARRTAYGSITGSGPNATVLHYPRDDREMQAGELVVADCTAEYQGYATDITRTFPVGGKFTPDERAVYEVVLRAQEAALATVRPGARIHEDVHEAAKRVIDEAGYGDYFIHGTSHFVGLEVHDAGVYSEPLPVGAVITVEPGIYMPQKKLGVRIEDVLVVTPTGYELLSKSIPKTVEEVEAALAKGGAR
jgi:Xaa-Pro aminopeptidase